MTRPEPPEGIRLRLATGDHALSTGLDYAGINDDGLHEWVVTFPNLTDAVSIHADMIPPRTTLRIQEGDAPR